MGNIYNSMEKTSSYTKLTGDNYILYAPTSAIIIVDDESDMLAIKTIGSRKTIGLVKE